jgi:Sulfotransferase family
VNGDFQRWGFKEVRLGATEATLLHWRYPKAKFVFLARNPYDCYRSLSASGWHHLYHSRPDIRVDSAAVLARHWNRIALSWSELPADFPAFRIKYEDLIGGRFDFRNLESWLGIEIREEVAISVIVGRTSRRHRLGWCERLIISHEAAAGMHALGYSKEA